MNTSSTTAEIKTLAKTSGLRSLLSISSGLGFFVAAGLHAGRYSRISAFAGKGPEGLLPLVQLLWVSFSAGLVVVGVIVFVTIWRFTPLSRWVLLVAGFLPAINAGLQVAYLGFVWPTAILVSLALVTWAAAIAQRGQTHVQQRYAA